MENPFETEKRVVRSTFLTVLCILTFVGSGWGFITSLFNLMVFSPERIVTQIQQITTFSGTEAQTSWFSSLMDSSLEVLQTTIMHGTAIYTLSALFALISLVGAFLMFKLKKIGFYLYVVAQIATLFILPIYSGWSKVVIISIMMSGFMTLLFIILYGINYRQLKN